MYRLLWIFRSEVQQRPLRSYEVFANNYDEAVKKVIEVSCGKEGSGTLTLVHATENYDCPKCTVNIPECNYEA